MKETWKFFIIAVVICCTLWLSIGALDMGKVVVSTPYFASLFLCYLLANVLRLYRLGVMTKPLGPSWMNVYLAHFSSGAFGLFPFKIGDVARLFFLNIATGSTLRSAAVLFLERIFDALMLMFWVFVLGIVFGSASDFNALGLLLAIGIAGGTGAVLGSYCLVHLSSRRAAGCMGDRTSLALLKRVQILRRGINIVRLLLSEGFPTLLVSSAMIWAIEIAVLSALVEAGSGSATVLGLSSIFDVILNSSDKVAGPHWVLLACFFLSSSASCVLLAAFMLVRKIPIGEKYSPSLHSKVVVVYDAAKKIPDSLLGVAGVRLFSQIQSQNGALITAFEDCARQGEGISFISDENVALLMYRVMTCPPDTVFVYISSQVVLKSCEVLHAIVELASLIEEGCQDDEGRVAIVKSRDGVLDFIKGERSSSLPAWLTFSKIGSDMAKSDELGELLSCNTATRHFNCLTAQGDVFIKSSADINKLQCEHDFFGLLPEHMQRWFVRPFDFSVSNGIASYTMERVNLPNVASVWVEGAYSPTQFDSLLNQLFTFIEDRATRPTSEVVASAMRRKLYQEKVALRFEKLKEWEEFYRLDKAFSGVTRSGSLDVFFSKYFALYESVSSQIPYRDLAVSHGDLCFSNILYSRDKEDMYFVDPRGAKQSNDLYLDPYYDVCKLSHSILGGYDFINMHKYEARLDGSFHAELIPAVSSLPWMREQFKEHIEAAGYDFRFVRLGELSLFMSMLPLHIDHPDKVLAFLVTAEKIMSEIEVA